MGRPNLGASSIATLAGQAGAKGMNGSAACTTIPGQATRVMGAGSVAEVQDILADLVYEALADLAREAEETTFKQRERTWRRAVRTAKRSRA